MVSCLFSKVQEFFHMLTAHLPSLFSEAVHVFQKVSFTLAMSCLNTCSSSLAGKEGMKAFPCFFKLSENSPNEYNRKILLFSEQPYYFNVLVIKQKTGPYSSGYGGFLTIPWTLSEVW